ncbi:MAG: TonB-dependent receptor [Sulfurimonas sp.]
MQKKLQLSLLSVALLSQLNAQELKLAPLEVSSTAIKTDELHAAQAVEVYTQEDIEKSHSQNLYEFFNQNTSLITMPSFGNPFTQKIDMRGYGITNGYQNIVVTINGRKMNNIDMVPQLLSSISPNQIERIEIVKSSGIIEGGDGANAGVINITTKSENSAEIGFYAGSYNTFDGNFYFGHSDDTLSLNLSGEAQKNGGIRYVDDNGAKDENKFSNFNFDLAYNPIDRLELRLNGATSDLDVWYAGALTQAEYDEDVYQKGSGSAAHQLYTSDVIGTGTSYDLTNKLTINGDFSHEYKTSQYLPYSPSKYVYNSYAVNFEYLNDSFSAKAGVDGFNGDRRSSTNITSKDNTAFYIAAKYKMGNNSFKAGYRFEKVEYKYAPTTGTTLTQSDKLHGAELGYNYTLNNTSSFFANYTKSFQAPDIDRFFNWGGTFNNFIKPMKADNYTLGYNRITATNKLKISAFYVDLKDEIYYYADPGFINSKNTNIDKSHKYGFDLYDKWLISKEFNLALNYNYVEAIIDEEIENGENYKNKDLPGVSNHNIKATFTYLPNSATTLSLIQVYRSKAYSANDFNNNASQKQEAYYSTDISATYAKENWEVFAKINNLFNQSNGLWVRDDAIYPVNFTTTARVGFTLKY